MVTKALSKSVVGLAMVLVLAPEVVAKPPSWDKKITGKGRFKVLKEFNGEAVLDKETGLVWQQAPETPPNPTTAVTWPEAQLICNTSDVGGRTGWRLPTLQELTSLQDPAIASPGPILPPGHPFSNVQSAAYWSATSDARDFTGAWFVAFNVAGANIVAKVGAFTRHVWCVRGGSGVDSQ
jgi:hypothetical protein